MMPQESNVYEDDFDDAGYGDEFEDTEKETEKEEAKPAEPAPVEQTEPVSGKDWDVMKKQLTQELQSPPDTGPQGSYADDFDPIGQDSALLAEESKFGSEADVKVEKAPRAAVTTAQTFEIELVDDDKGGVGGESSINSLKDAIKNAANSVGDGDDYADDDFDD